MKTFACSGQPVAASVTRPSIFHVGAIGSATSCVVVVPAVTSTPVSVFGI